MTGIVKDAALNTKIRSKMGGRLRKSDYNTMMGMNSVSEAAAYLKNNTRYKETLKGINEAYIHRGQIEELLRVSLVDDIESILPFVAITDRFFIKLYVIKYEIENIKLFLRLLTSGHLRQYSENAIFRFKKMGNFDADALFALDTFDDFIQFINNTPYSHIFRPFASSKEEQNLFNMEQALDMYFVSLSYRYIRRNLKTKVQNEIFKTLAVETDLANILFILRAKAYFTFTPNEILSYIVPRHFGIKKADITEMVESKTYDEAMAVVMRTKYRSVLSGREQYSEKGINEYSEKLYRKLFASFPYSVAAPVSYIRAKEAEIRNIISIIEGIRYGVPSQEIKDLITEVK